MGQFLTGFESSRVRPYAGLRYYYLRAAGGSRGLRLSLSVRLDPMDVTTWQDENETEYAGGWIASGITGVGANARAVIRQTRALVP